MTHNGDLECIPDKGNIEPVEDSELVAVEEVVEDNENSGSNSVRWHQLLGLGGRLGSFWR